MKKIIFYIYMAVLPISISAQQLPFYTQYMVNDFSLNPAVAGTKDFNEVLLNFRNQWTGFNDAPVTQTASLHANLHKNVGVGGLLFNDMTGPISRSGIQLAYSYIIPFKGDHKLSFGLAGLLYQHVIDKDKLTLDQQGDIAVQGGKQRNMLGDAVFGMYYKKENLFAGFSAPQLFQSKLDINPQQAEKLNKLSRHYYLNAGYDIEIGPDVIIQPSALMKAMSAVPVQVDGNIKFMYRRIFWVGASYRSSDAMIVLTGVQYNGFLLAYSYDATLSSIKKYSTGSHEITLGMQFNQGKKKSKASYN
jgi:type IX secretion system PorP/SprF family membrane protein